MAKTKDTQYGKAKAKFKDWVEKASLGREKKIGWIMLVVAFGIMGYQLYNRFFNPPEERKTIGDIFEGIKTPVEDNIVTDDNNFWYDYEMMKKDEKALDIIKQMQYIYSQKPIDSVKFRELQTELQSLNIKLDK